MTKAKVRGVTNPEDALVAAEVLGELLFGIPNVPTEDPTPVTLPSEAE